MQDMNCARVSRVAAVAAMTALSLSGPVTVSAAEYQETSIALLYGWDKEAVFSGGEFATDVTTIEHFSSTAYGNNFFFFDTENLTGDANEIAGGGSEVYAEYTVAFSYNKLADG